MPVSDDIRALLCPDRVEQFLADESYLLIRHVREQRERDDLARGSVRYRQWPARISLVRHHPVAGNRVVQASLDAPLPQPAADAIALGNAGDHQVIRVASIGG